MPICEHPLGSPDPKDYEYLEECKNCGLIVCTTTGVAPNQSTKDLLSRGVKMRSEDDPVNSPQHYTKGKFEVADVIDDWNLGFFLGNVIKYIARCRYKGKELEDLRKARWYLNFRIKKLEKVEKG